METLDLSSLFGPQPVFLTKEQLAAAQELVDRDDAVAVAFFNEGGMVTSARLIIGARPIPSEAEPQLETEVLLSAPGGVFPTNATADDDGPAYQAKFEAAYESAYAENAELIAAEEAAQTREAILQ